MSPHRNRGPREHHPAHHGPPSQKSAPETTEVTWIATSRILPGQNVTHDPKTITLDGDVSIDGWTSSSTPIPDAGGVGVDNVEEVNNVTFRVIAGTTHPLENVSATITAADDSAAFTFGEPQTASSPALAATPQRYREIVLDDVTNATRTSDTELAWGVTESGTMPGEPGEDDAEGRGSSAMFNVTGIPAEDLTGTEPIVVTLTFTGEYTEVVDCATTEPTTDATTDPTSDPTSPAVDCPCLVSASLQCSPARSARLTSSTPTAVSTIAARGFAEGEVVTLEVTAGPENVEGVTLTEVANEDGIAVFAVYGTNAAQASVYLGDYEVSVTGAADEEIGADPLTGSFTVGCPAGSEGEAGGSSSSDNLPRTGGELTGLGVGIGLLIAGGATILLANRRQKA